MKKEKGITLISLVITIIVLLILAGVGISLTLNNGIINKSKIAKQNYENSSQTEEYELGELNNKIESYAYTTRGDIEKQKVEKIEISDIVSDWIIENNSVKIGDMVYIDLIINKNPLRTTGWNRNIAKVSCAPKKAKNFATLNEYEGKSTGEISIDVDGKISVYDVGKTSGAICVNAFYYVGE